MELPAIDHELLLPVAHALELVMAAGASPKVGSQGKRRISGG